MLDATDQANYEVVKKVLLATYQVISETYRKLVFGKILDIANPDAWLRKHRQNFCQWLRMSDKAPEELMLMETNYQKLPWWLETAMRNLNLGTFEELAEATVRYQGNQRKLEEVKRRSKPRVGPWLTLNRTTYQSRPPEQRNLERECKIETKPFPPRKQANLSVIGVEKRSYQKELQG